MIAGKEEIERQKVFGRDHFVYEENSYFIDVNDDSERMWFQNRIGVPNYKWFQEGTGDRHWVLYNPICFMPTKNWNGKKILKFNYREFKGGRLEVPINASSCCGMFSWVTLPEGFQIGGLFNTRGIKDMNLMFAGCVMPKGFSLGDHFHTKEVEDMRYMFYQSSVSEAFDFGKIFDTSHVMNMEYMFSECRIPDGLKFPERFLTAQVTNMDHMFYESVFLGKADFGDGFVVSPGTNTNDMFTDCMFGDEKIDNKYNQDFNYVKSRLS